MKSTRIQAHGHIFKKPVFAMFQGYPVAIRMGSKGDKLFWLWNERLRGNYAITRKAQAREIRSFDALCSSLGLAGVSEMARNGLYEWWIAKEIAIPGREK